jgi:phosphoribosylanthranilate isomerase
VVRAEDVRCALDCGARLIGLNFYSGSPRHLELDLARRLRDIVGDRALVVGVFVDAEPERVVEVENAVGLDLVQFHGNEPLSGIAPFAARAIRVLRPERSLAADALEPYADFWGVLFDTPPPARDAGVVDVFGGSGKSWRYDRIATCLDRGPSSPRLLLAGGLRPETVAGVLTEVPGLWGIDVCSGVESAPGIKDAAKMQELFRQVARTGRPPGAAPTSMDSPEL